MAKNYYVILGVEPDASQEEIKSAYRQKVKEFHPDYYGEDSGPFLAIQEAYSVLSDPERRRAYDEELAGRTRFQDIPVSSGVEPLRPQRFAAEPLIPHQPFPEFVGDLFGWPFRSLERSFDRFFESFWSDFERPGQSFKVTITLSRVQARHGGQMRILIPVEERCSACWGRGYLSFYECPHCFGSGIVIEERPLLIEFPAGIADGDRVRVALDRFGFANTELIIHFRVL